MSYTNCLRSETTAQPDSYPGDALPRLIPVAPIFSPLPDKPDHDALELEILDALGARGHVRAASRAEPRRAAVQLHRRPDHGEQRRWACTHAWGRTLKDVFQRYKALRGFDQRYQNGFDCQGLWIEVGVERELGLNSKREIEEYGLAEFAARCRERVACSREEITERLAAPRPVDGLGGRLLHVLRHEHRVHLAVPQRVHERGWLYQGHRSTVWCPRCGTSISQHEVFSGRVPGARAPLALRPVPAAGAATASRSSSGRRRRGRCPRTSPPPSTRRPSTACARTASGCAVARVPGRDLLRTALGSELVGLDVRGAVRRPSGAARASTTASSRGTRSRSRRARGSSTSRPARAEDFELGRIHDLPVLAPVDEAGRFYTASGGCTGSRRTTPPSRSSAGSQSEGSCSRPARIVHRYPNCWRCDTPLILRVIDDWLIAVDEVRQPMLEANATRGVDARVLSKRMDDWLRNMGDWNISRQRYYGLPLPIYPCECGHVNVVGSQAELEERAARGLDQLAGAAPAVDRRGADPLRGLRRGGVADPRGRRRLARRGHRPVLDARLGELRVRARGLRRPARRRGSRRPTSPTTPTGSSGSRPTGSRRCASRSGSGSTRSRSCRSRSSAGRRSGACSTYEKLLDENGREMHRSWGNAIDGGRGVRAHGRGRHALAVLLAAAEPEPPLRLRPGARDPAQAPDALELVQVPRRLREHRRLGRRSWADLDGRAGRRAPAPRPLARLADERARRGGDRGYESWLTVDVVRAFESFVEDVSNWYIRRSRRRFWDGDAAALRRSGTRSSRACASSRRSCRSSPTTSGGS